MRRYGLMFAMLALAASASAEVYKWVDEKGVTHYGEHAPPNAKSKEIRLRDASPRYGGASAAASDAALLKDRDLEFRKRLVTREREETRVREEKAQLALACRSARAELLNLKATGKLYELNDKGERVFMSDAQREAEIARREADYNRRCN